MDHDTLARSLADHLRSPERMVWCDIQLGNAGSPRPDVYTIMKSFMHPSPMAYECKVTAADFLADVTVGKWQTYLKFACGVVFACEAGLLNKDVIPYHCGLIILKEGRWRAAKRAILNPVVIPQDALLKLLIDGVQREGPIYRRRIWHDSMMSKILSQRHGDVVARAVRDVAAIQHEVEDRRAQAQCIVDAATRQANLIKEEATDWIAPQRAELCEILGLPSDTHRFEVEAALRELKRNLTEHPAQANLRRLTEHLQQTLQHYGWKEPSC